MTPSLFSLYKHRLHLENADFLYIDHEDAIVATVFKVRMPDGTDLILKICSREDHFWREVYFLHHFIDKLPVPRIVRLVEPDGALDGAILMECLPGALLKKVDLTKKLAFGVGSLLATIHLERVKGYGDLIKPEKLNCDPRVPFTLKFEEGLEECSPHLPESLMEKCRRYYYQHLDSLLSTDGPCMIHRDFRPGNVFANHGKVSGIIDWASARGGFAEEDFCPLEFEEWSHKTSYKNSFLSGYESVRKIPNYKGIMPLLCLSRAVATIGFTVKRGIWQSKGARLYQFHRHFLDEFVQ